MNRHPGDRNREEFAVGVGQGKEWIEVGQGKEWIEVEVGSEH